MPYRNLKEGAESLLKIGFSLKDLIKDLPDDMPVITPITEERCLVILTTFEKVQKCPDTVMYCFYDEDNPLPVKIEEALVIE